MLATVLGDVVRNPPPDFRVRFHAMSFPDHVVPYSGEIWFSEDDLAHALFTTGRAPADRFAHGSASVYEWLHRASLIPAYVRRAYHAGLVRSDLALTLDRSESVAVSYALGQAMTAIFCRTQLGVTHLLHVDRYSAQHGVHFGQTRRRSDLFGVAPEGWVVAEAKGRSGGVSSDLRRTLEEQKRSVSEIEGKPPWLALGCVAHFPRRQGPMYVDAFDPDEDSIESVSFSLTRDLYAMAYYLPFLRAFEFGDADESGAFRIVSFSGFGLRLRMSSDLLARIRDAEAGAVEGVWNDVQYILEDVRSREIGVLPDGSAVETDWQRSIDGPGFGQFER
jgi:hypothetical protein